jgi:phage shock protein A
MPPQATHVSLRGASSSASAGELRVYIRAGIPEDAPLQEQVDALRRELDQAQDQIERLRNHLSRDIQQVREAIAAEAQERTAADTAIRQHQIKVSFEGWEWELVGVGYFFVGTVLGTFF